MNSPATIPSAHKEWVKHLKSLVGGDTKVISYADESNQNKIPIFTSSNADGVVAATVGLMEIDQSRNPKNKVPTEIIMDQLGHDERISNVLSTIAFYIMKDGWKVAPGVIFESMIEMYIPETQLPHVMFVSPFQWSNMSRLQLTDRTIYPLIAVPISEAESKVANENQGRALEALWESRGTNVLNWERSSAA